MKLFKQTIFILIICISTLYPQFYIAPQAGINGIASYTKDSGLDFGVNRGQLYGAEIGYKFFGFIGVKGSAMYANKEFNQTRQLTNINNNVVSDDLYTETLNMKNGAIELKGSILLSLGRYEISIGPQLDQLLTSVQLPPANKCLIQSMIAVYPLIMTLLMIWQEKALIQIIQRKTAIISMNLFLASI